MKKSFTVLALVGSVMGNALAATAEVTGLKNLADLPSASGMVLFQQQLYVVGDDSPSLYRLDPEFQRLGEVAVYPWIADKTSRIASDQKADLEASEMLQIDGQPVLVMLGSGTQEDRREQALLYSLASQQPQWKNVRPLYRYLRKVAGLSASEFINIEGLACSDHQVFLLSRGSHGPNLIFTLSKADFVNYLTGKLTHIEHITAQRVQLPQLDAHQATLSGAEFDAAGQQLVVTASVDAGDQDAHGKGEQLKGIRGSFIATIPLTQLASKADLDLTASAALISHQGQPLRSKVEAIALDVNLQHGLSGVLAADNDDGFSQLMRFSYQ